MKTDQLFSNLVSELSEPLYWHLRRLVVCHEDAQDLLQDTFESACLHLWQLRDPSKAKAWLYAVATNKARRFLRRKARMLHTEDLSEYLSHELCASPYVNYEKAAVINLHKAILSLPPVQQLVFNLRYFDEMDYEQISQITGTSVDSLRVNWHLAKNKVKKYIDDEQI